jgi:hypothetical protein
VRNVPPSLVGRGRVSFRERYARDTVRTDGAEAGHLVQRKRADCGTASPVIAALCGQNANRQSEHERCGGDDYAFCHHGSPLGFYVHVACIAVYSTAACDGRHKLGDYGESDSCHSAAVRLCPLCPESGQNSRRLSVSALCHNRS